MAVHCGFRPTWTKGIPVSLGEETAWSRERATDYHVSTRVRPVVVPFLFGVQIVQI
jgi:hypothetical protein